MHHRDTTSPDDALRLVTDALGDKLTESRLNGDHLDLVCPPEHFVELMTHLRDAERLRCRFFTFLSGVDRSAVGGEGNGDSHAGLEVLVHVYSPDHVVNATVHVPVDPARAVCPSISKVYAGAVWHERETWEMFGIHFEGHPKLVNLYLPEDFEGHPLLKSFKLPSRSVKEWPGAKDPEEAAGGRG